jgi:hypothetical protein
MNDKPRKPRDWLLRRHADAMPRLDAIRTAVLPAPSLTWPQFWRHVFAEHRAYWSALAAVWVAIAALQLNRDFSSDSRNTSDPIPRSAIAQWIEQHDSHATIASIGYRR